MSISYSGLDCVTVAKNEYDTVFVLLVWQYCYATTVLIHQCVSTLAMLRNRYKPIVISSYVVHVTNGQVLTSFTASTAGIYVIGMQLSSNPLGLDVSQTQELWFATNATYREELDTGVALVR